MESVAAFLEFAREAVITVLLVILLAVTVKNVFAEKLKKYSEWHV